MSQDNPGTTLQDPPDIASHVYILGMSKGLPFSIIWTHIHVYALGPPTPPNWYVIRTVWGCWGCILMCALEFLISPYMLLSRMLASGTVLENPGHLKAALDITPIIQEEQTHKWIWRFSTYKLYILFSVHMFTKKSSHVCLNACHAQALQSSFSVLHVSFTVDTGRN